MPLVPVQVDLSQKTCIVTGASSGVGKEIARALARMGATVIVTSPGADRAHAARAEISAEEVARALAAQVRAIDYPNFKATVRDAGRLHAYHDVWDVMARYQEVKHPRDR